MYIVPGIQWVSRTSVSNSSYRGLDGSGRSMLCCSMGGVSSLPDHNRRSRLGPERIHRLLSHLHTIWSYLRSVQLIDRILSYSIGGKEISCRIDCNSDRFFFLLLEKPPVRAPNAVNTPAQLFEDALSRAVASAGNERAVIASTITFDSQ